MNTCPNCGAELEGKFCSYCGSPAPTDFSQPEPTPAPAPAQIPRPEPQPAYRQQPMYNNVNQPQNVTGVGSWLGWLLLIAFTNIIGIIIMLCCAKDKTVKNFAIAYLIYTGIAIVIVFAIMIFFFAAASSSGHSYY